MYGQADPGGLINSVPKMAQHNKDFTRIKGTVGNKDHVRAEFDANYVLNDDLAVRFMGMDMSRDLDQLYEYSNKTGGTVELSYRPTNKTQLRAHLEHMNLDQNLAPGMFKSTGNDQRFAPNSPQDNGQFVDGVFDPANPSYTLGTYRNEFIYSPDAAKLVPDEIIADLRLNQAFADRFNGDPVLDNNNNPTGDFIPGSGDTTVTRDDLRRIWSNPGINQDDRYSVTGPDKFNKRKGNIISADWTQQLKDDLQFKIAINNEDVDRESLARDGYSSGRVISDRPLTAQEITRQTDTNDFNDVDVGEVDINGQIVRPFDPYINTYWRRQEGNTEANAFKGTLLYDFELDESFIMPGPSKHKALFGADLDRLQKDNREFNQIQDGVELVTSDDGGEYFFSSYGYPALPSRSDLNKEKLYLSDGFGPNSTNPMAYNGRDDLMQLARESRLDSKTKSAWFALQSEFLDGRLRTLVGYRYDDIEVDYFDRRYKIALPKGTYTNRTIDDGTGNLVNFRPETASAIIDDEANYHHLSPTIGTLYWITNEVGFFANYAESIQSPTEIDLDPWGELLPAVTGEGYEFGLRFDLFDGKLNGQISSFYIEKENDKIVNYDYRLNEVLDTPEMRAQFPQYWNPANGNLINDALPGKRLAGDKSRAEGVELEFYYNPNRNLSFIVSYAYNNLDAIEIADGVNPRFSEVWGQAPHNALLIGRYKFTSGALKGLTVGANQSFRSSSSIGEWYIEESTDPITNASQGTWYEVKFDPEYVTSAFLNYERKLGKGRGVPVLNLGLRVNNLFDDTDLINRNKGAFHRASRQYLLSANLRF
jgi:hypothetical protein